MKDMRVSIQEFLERGEVFSGSWQGYALERSAVAFPLACKENQEGLKTMMTEGMIAPYFR